MTTGRRPATDEQTSERPSAPRRRPTARVIVVAILVLALLVALHLTGAVGPGAH